MKHVKLILTTLTLAAFTSLSSTFAQAVDEVAVFSLKFGKDKNLRQVVIDLDEVNAPKTSENFKKLARKRFYKKVLIHRVAPNFLVQTGDPLSKRKDKSEAGTGGPGYTIPAEIRNKITRGSVVTARLPDDINPARHSNGSQFYFALTNMPDRNGKDTVFGHVISGIEILDEISLKNTDTNNFPIEKIQIRSIKILPKSQFTPTTE